MTSASSVRPITTTTGENQRAIMNTGLRRKQRAYMMKAGCLLIMHWSILTSPLSAGEIPVVPAAEAGLSERSWPKSTSSWNTKSPTRRSPAGS